MTLVCCICLSREFNELIRQVRRWRIFSVLIAVVYIVVVYSTSVRLDTAVQAVRSGDKQSGFQPFFVPEDPSKTPDGVPFDRLTTETGE